MGDDPRRDPQLLPQCALDMLESKITHATGALAKTDWRPDRLHIEVMRNAMERAKEYIDDARATATFSQLGQDDAGLDLDPDGETDLEKLARQIEGYGKGASKLHRDIGADFGNAAKVVRAYAALEAARRIAALSAGREEPIGGGERREIIEALAGAVVAWAKFYPGLMPQDEAEAAEWGPMLKARHMLGRLLTPRTSHAGEIEEAARQIVSASPSGGADNG